MSLAAQHCSRDKKSLNRWTTKKQKGRYRKFTLIDTGYTPRAIREKRRTYR
jgi:hypothetical protein